MKKSVRSAFSAFALFVCAASAASAAVTAPKVKEVPLAAGVMTVFDYGDVKLHAYATGDALADEAYIVEGADALVGIELPPFTANLEAWKSYIGGLNKPMKDLFVSAHPAGASYAEGMTIYGTEAAKNAIAGGSTAAITEGLHKAFGDEFRGGDTVSIAKVLAAGPVTLGGVEFILVAQGDAYDIVIPAINAVSTHMLGKHTHSIIGGAAHMDAMLKTLRGYREAQYAMILPAHSAPEGQDAVSEKIRYVEKLKELAASSGSDEEFKKGAIAAFPQYDGLNYLDMTAAALFPAE
ncbi:MAG: hypothetical protein MR616_03330 [Pyramidobacter sp.]|nr:hypothetical protein [Pyramidobacter sp.]